MIYLSNRHIVPSPTWYPSSNGTIKQVSMTLYQNAVSRFSQLKKKQKAVTAFIQLLFQCHLAPVRLRPTRAPRVGWLYCSICYSSHRKNLKPSSSRGLKRGPCSRLVDGNNPGSAGSSLLTAIQALGDWGAGKRSRGTRDPACRTSLPGNSTRLHPSLAWVHIKRQTSGYGRKGGQFKRNLGETDKRYRQTLQTPFKKASSPQVLWGAHEDPWRRWGGQWAVSTPGHTCSPPPRRAPQAPAPPARRTLHSSLWGSADLRPSQSPLKRHFKLGWRIQAEGRLWTER